MRINDLNKLTAHELDNLRRNSCADYNELNWFLMKESKTGSININTLKELREFKITLPSRMEILFDLLAFEKEKRHLLQIVNNNKLTTKFDLFRYNRDKYNADHTKRMANINNNQTSSHLQIVT